MDAGDQRGEAVREDIRRGPPVAKAGGVIAAPCKPAIIQYEAFDAEARGIIGQRHQGGFGQVEPERFPRIEMHLALRPPGAGGQDFGAQAGVEGLAERAAIRRDGERGLGRLESLTRRKHDFARLPACRQLQHGSAVACAAGVAFEVGGKIPAPRKVRSQTLLVRAVQQQPVAAIKPRLAPARLAAQAIRRDGAAALLHFARPAACIAGEFGKAARHWQGKAGKVFDLKRRSAKIGQRRVAAHHIARADLPVELRCDPGCLIAQGQDDRRAAGLPVGAPQIRRQLPAPAPHKDRRAGKKPALGLGQQASGGGHIGLAFVPRARGGGIKRCQILVCREPRPGMHQPHRAAALTREHQRQRAAINPCVVGRACQVEPFPA